MAEQAGAPLSVTEGVDQHVQQQKAEGLNWVPDQQLLQTILNMFSQSHVADTQVQSQIYMVSQTTQDQHVLPSRRALTHAA